MNDLTNDELTILKRLDKTGAATLTDLAVGLRDLPEKVGPKLTKFKAKGFVEVKDIDGKYDREVYRVSDKGRRFLQLLQNS